LRSNEVPKYQKNTTKGIGEHLENCHSRGLVWGNRAEGSTGIERKVEKWGCVAQEQRMGIRAREAKNRWYPRREKDGLSKDFAGVRRPAAGATGGERERQPVLGKKTITGGQ